jgi:hypothetical protein
MAFDFNLRLRVFSRGTERNQAAISSQGVRSMSDWLDDELVEIEHEKHEEKAKEQRLALLQKQTDVLWEHLKTELARSVDRMNEPDSQFRKMTGGVNISPIKDANKIKIRKPYAMPKIEVEVSREPVAVSWYYTVSRDAKDLEGRPREGTRYAAWWC